MKKLLLLMAVCLFFTINLYSQCTSAPGGQYPSATITVGTSTTAVTINGCNYTSEYSVLDGAVLGNIYEFSCTLNSDGTHKYVTVTDASGAAIDWGPSPFSWTSTLTGGFRVYWTDDAACATTSSCHTTTVTCTSCCVAPTVSIPADPIDNMNCPASVDVSISIDDMGGSSMLTITGEDALGNPAGTGGTVSATGIFTITNIPSPQTGWNIKIAHETDPTCDVILGPFALDCPPENDICTGATYIGGGGSVTGSFTGGETNSIADQACDGYTNTSPDLWFIVNTDNDNISGEELLITVAPAPGVDIALYVYSGTCGALIYEDCDDAGFGGATEEVTITVPAGLKDKGSSSTRNNIDYFIRIKQWGFSDLPFTVTTSGSALPVVLGDFDAEAKRRGNMIKWSTLSEINSDYIEVQSSPNGSTRWETVGKVQTKGESLSRLDYELLDNNPYAISYYRLKAVDKDGKSEMSHAVSVKRDDKLGQMSLSPNPTSSNISLQTVSESDMIGTITILDMAGKIVQKESVNLKNGLNTVSVDLENLSTGIYLFSLKTEDGIQVEKIVKQ